jgi:hypothetical protein
MELTHAFLADAANMTESGKLNVLGVFNQIYSANFPYRHPQMTCVVRLMAQPAEFGKEKDLEITLMDSDGKSLGALRAETTVPTPEGGRRAYIELILGLNNVPFQHPGDYEFAILVDGEQKGTIPIEVVERKPEVQA